MISTPTSLVSRLTLAIAAVCATAMAANAADSKPVAAASQANAKKADDKKKAAKPAQGLDAKTVNNNPAGKADDGSNGPGIKKPSGPKFPEAAAK